MAEILKDAYREIIKSALKAEKRTDIEKIKSSVCRKFSLGRVPKNSEILEFTTKKEKEILKGILLKKPTRSISGVSVVAVMAQPYDCPHGVCAYCPRGEDAPQSYTGKEPATRRAKMNKYDPALQVNNRLSQLNAIGHPTNKVELIIMGGTFPAQSFSYQKKFVKGCLEAMIGTSVANLEKAKLKAEKSRVRPIGITIETRPDYCKEKEINRMLEIGATRVEIGVQTIYDDILKKVDRACTVKDTIEATQLMKDSGLKVAYHIMPGLPGSDKKKDLKVFETIFKDQKFRPDMLKVYPTLVIKGTKLYDWWKAGKYTPLNSKEAAEIVALAKKHFPPWVRVMRITRDIPSNLIEAGVKKSNLRELVRKRAKELGINCNCIRCREVGHRFRKEKVLPENIEIKVQKYKASEGKEFFISVEDFKRGILVGYLKMRIPSKKFFREEISQDTALIRELHVYGPEVSLGLKGKENEFQHKGWGKKLLKKAEEIALEQKKNEVLVLSAIGAKEYFRRLGYKDKGVYVYKKVG